MRGIETSSTATSGFSRTACSSASTPSSASAITSMSGWRSSSSFTPERTMPWSSAIRILTRPPPAAGVGVRRGRLGAPAGTSSSTVVPLARARVDLERAAHQQRALAHAGEPEPLALLGEGEAGAVVGDLQADPRVARLEAHLDAGRAGVAGGVHERLLGDAVDDHLRVRRQRRPGADRPRRWHARGRAGRSRARGCAAPRPGRGRRAPSGAAGARGRAARPSPGRRGASSPPAAAAARAARPGWRPRSAAAGRSATGSPRRGGRARCACAPPPGRAGPARPERRRSFSSRSSMRLKVAASRSMSVETPGHVGVELEPPAGPREVHPLHHRQQALERLEPAPQQQRVEQEGQHQRQRQHQELPALVLRSRSRTRRRRSRRGCPPSPSAG